MRGVEAYFFERERIEADKVPDMVFHSQLSRTHDDGDEDSRAYDPYMVLNLPRNFTLEQLRYNYKVLARKLHPDKCGLQVPKEQINKTFQLLTDAYRALLHEHSVRQGDKPFYALRDGAKEDAERRGGGGGGGVGVGPGGGGKNEAAYKAAQGFSMERFNRVFDETRVKDPVADAGYTEWMAKNDPERGVSRDEAARNRQVIKYVEPTPLTVSRRGCVPFTELGVDSVADYSRDDNARHGITYTDYRVAHTTTKLVDEVAAIAERREFSGIDDIRKHRASISFNMTPEDAQANAERKRALEEQEEMKQLSQREYDRRLNKHFERVHRRLLGYSGTSTI